MNITSHTACTHLSPLTLQNLNGDIGVVQALAVRSRTDGSVLVRMFNYSNPVKQERNSEAWSYTVRWSGDFLLVQVTLSPILTGLSLHLIRLSLTDAHSCPALPLFMAPSHLLVTLTAQPLIA